LRYDLFRAEQIKNNSYRVERRVQRVLPSISGRAGSAGGRHATVWKFEVSDQPGHDDAGRNFLQAQCRIVLALHGKCSGQQCVGLNLQERKVSVHGEGNFRKGEEGDGCNNRSAVGTIVPQV
jgi:hypothetical protein